MEIKTVGVVGCGLMGSGISQTCAQAGYRVVVSDVDQEGLAKGVGRIRASLAKLVEKGKLRDQERSAVMARIETTVKIGDFSQCDIIVEALPEDLSIKKTALGRLDGICGPHVIFGSNTSSLSILDMAVVTKRPDKVLGIHFQQPAPVMKLLELVRSMETSEESVEVGRRFGESLGKTVIVAPDLPGFIGARLITPYLLNAVRMVENSIGTAEEIDTAARLGFNHPLGPLGLIDFIGLDTEYNIAKSMYEDLKDPQYAPPVLLKKMVAAGYLGRKSGRGFYKYS